ncbi:MAG: PEP-CTERM sorting domain-containing protein [Acidobacteria bacterium]|nr:PEP-CTERM sorting domain-containing protein [Acidobacteriota bacterium]
MSVLAFIAPTADTYYFSGQIHDHDTVGGNGVRFSAALGNGTLLSDTSAGAVFSPVVFNFSQALAAGQKVYFALGAQGDFSYDSVGLSLNVRDSALAPVPEPGSLVLVPLGAAAFWALRRRR